MSSKRRETRINLDLPGNLPTVEESLLDLAITLEMLSQPGLTKPEIQRFHWKKMRYPAGLSKLKVHAIQKAELK